MTHHEFDPLSIGLTIEASNISMASSNGEPMLDNVSTTIHQGEFIAIHGKSGAGKTLFATALCGIRFNEGKAPTRVGAITRKALSSSAARLGFTVPEREPTIQYSGDVRYTLSDKNGWSLQLPEDYNIKARHIGFVPQASVLDPNMSVRDNIELPARLEGVPIDEENLEKVYATLDLEKALEKKAGVLSGGEAQRVALARALSKNPHAIILDEPTAGLNPELKKQTNIKLQEINQEFNKTVITVTHEESLATRRIEMSSGRIVGDTKVE